MVYISRICFRQRGNFIDNLRLYVRGGAGGMGLPRLGGRGGNGGDVWVVATKNTFLLNVKEAYPRKRITAGSGRNSCIAALTGLKGEDREIFAPIGISVTADDGTIIGELNGEGDRVRVVKGGSGGSFKSEFKPKKGQTRHIRLDLKLIADVGLVGFPNAGKSSLLSALSNSKTEVASYPFTTLDPMIGILMYPDHKQISMADLPGLIEGAHINKGMGHKFLKHVERTKQLLFVVDVCGFQLAPQQPFRSAFETVQLLTKELELYREELLSKPALLAVNKMDLPEAEDKLSELKEQLQKPEAFVDLLPDDMIPKSFLTFRHIMPISAASGSGLDHLKTCVRQSLHEQNVMNMNAEHQEKLQELRDHLA